MPLRAPLPFLSPTLCPYPNMPPGSHIMCFTLPPVPHPHSAPQSVSLDAWYLPTAIALSLILIDELRKALLAAAVATVYGVGTLGAAPPPFGPLVPSFASAMRATATGPLAIKWLL